MVSMQRRVTCVSMAGIQVLSTAALPRPWTCLSSDGEGGDENALNAESREERRQVARQPERHLPRTATISRQSSVMHTHAGRGSTASRSANARQLPVDKDSAVPPAKRMSRQADSMHTESLCSR